MKGKILESVCNGRWNPSTYVFTVTGVSSEDAFRFINEGVYDDHIPVRKPIGFKISMPSSNAKASVITRSYACLENQITLSNNFDFIVTTFSQEVKADDIVVEFTNDEITIASNWLCHQQKVELLGIEQHICQPVLPMGLYVKTFLGTGYMHMEKTANRVDNDYFPLCVSFSLKPYIRILPFVDNEIRIRFINGFTFELFYYHMLRMLEMYKENRLWKEEREWLSSFDV